MYKDGVNVREKGFLTIETFAGAIIFTQVNSNSLIIPCYFLPEVLATITKSAESWRLRRIGRMTGV